MSLRSDPFVITLRTAAGRLRGGHVVALATVAVAAFGLLGLRAVELPQARPISDTDRLRIELVQPVEPEIVPGAVMEVGELVDGFQGLPRRRPVLIDAAWAPADDWDDGDWSSPPPPDRRMYGSRVESSQPEGVSEPRRRAGSGWFGFDEARRDFLAEREARRARLAAMERRARDHEAERRRYERPSPPWAGERRYASAGPGRDRDPPRERDWTPYEERAPAPPPWAR